MKKSCLIISASVAALIAVSCSHEVGGKAGDGVTVSTAVSQKGSVVKKISVSGVLAPDRVVAVAAKLAGLAAAVNTDVGQQVKEGQLLVQIDARELAAQLKIAEASVAGISDQVDQAQAALEGAKSAYDLAQATMNRDTALRASHALSQSIYDDDNNKLAQAKTAYTNADLRLKMLKGSSLSQTQGQVDLIKAQLSNATILSPISGAVTTRNITKGELVGQGVPILTIVDQSVLRLQGNVTQNDVPYLSIGQHVAVAVNGIARKMDGTITQIGPMAASSGQYFPVVISIKNDGSLLSGMTATASFATAPASGVTVPAQAVRSDNGAAEVYTINNGIVTDNKVDVGLVNDSNALILSGIPEGVTVAASNVEMLRSGMRVNIGK